MRSIYHSKKSIMMAFFQQRLANFPLTYRTTPHTTANIVPCELLMGHPLRTRLDLLQSNLEMRLNRSKDMMNTVKLVISNQATQYRSETFVVILSGYQV